MTAPESSLRTGADTAPAGGDTAPALPRRADSRGSEGGQGRTWRIEFPPQQELLNSNQRRNRYAEARIVRQLRGDAYKLARYHKVPRLDRMRVDCIYEPPKRGRRDSGNWYPTAKAMIDGLIDAGVCEDDDHTRVDGPHMDIGDQFPGGRIVLIVTELPTPAQQGDRP